MSKYKKKKYKNSSKKSLTCENNINYQKENSIKYINKKRNRNIQNDDNNLDINSKTPLKKVENDEKSLLNSTNTNNKQDINKLNNNPTNIQYLKIITNDLYSHFFDKDYYYNALFN